MSQGNRHRFLLSNEQLLAAPLLLFFFTSSQKCERPNQAPLNHKQPFFLAGGFKHRAKYSVFSAFISWSLAVVQNKEWRSKKEDAKLKELNLSWKKKRKSICCHVAKQKNSFVFVSREHRNLCFPSLVSMWPGEIRQEETGGWYQDPLYWPLRAKLLRFCSGAGNSGAASGAKSQNTLDSFFLLLLFVKKQSAACFLRKSRLFSRQRSRLYQSLDVRATPIRVYVTQTARRRVITVSLWTGIDRMWWMFTR